MDHTPEFQVVIPKKRKHVSENDTNTISKSISDSNRIILKKVSKISESNIQAFGQEWENLEKSNSENQAKYHDLFNRLMNVIKTLTDERNKKTSAAKKRIEALKQEKETLRKQLQVSLTKSTELESQIQQDLEQATKLKVKHDQKVLELENELIEIRQQRDELEVEKQHALEKMENQYTHIVKNLKLKAEARKCTGCDGSKMELFCSSLCQHFW